MAIDDVIDAVGPEDAVGHQCATDGFGCNDCGSCGEPLTEHTWPRRHCPQPKGHVYDPNSPDEVYDSIGCVFH